MDGPKPPLARTELRCAGVSGAEMTKEGFLNVVARVE